MPFVPTLEQQLILAHDPHQHARVLAGPGTGKSATIVALISQLLATDSPPRVKLLTFTRAATGELAKKLSEHPTAIVECPSTIHSFAISVLLRNPGVRGLPVPLRVADDWEYAVRTWAGNRKACLRRPPGSRRRRTLLQPGRYAAQSCLHRVERSGLRLIGLTRRASARFQRIRSLARDTVSFDVLVNTKVPGGVCSGGQA